MWTSRLISIISCKSLHNRLDQRRSVQLSWSMNQRESYSSVEGASLKRGCVSIPSFA